MVKTTAKNIVIKMTVNVISYYRTITVQDYTELSGNSSKTAEVLKKITVEIAYKDQNKNKSVTLSTIKVKGD